MKGKWIYSLYEWNSTFSSKVTIESIHNTFENWMRNWPLWHCNCLCIMCEHLCVLYWKDSKSCSLKLMTVKYCHNYHAGGCMICNCRCAYNIKKLLNLGFSIIFYLNKKCVGLFKQYTRRTTTVNGVRVRFRNRLFICYRQR